MEAAMKRWLVMVCVVVMAGSMFAFGALADAGAAPDGNANGTVKIVEPGGEDALPANDPHVCTFRVAGLGFDAGEQVTLHVEGQGGPNTGVDTYNNTVNADAGGEFLTGVVTLTPGLYKLDADGADSSGAGKHKVFTVECEAPTT